MHKKEGLLKNRLRSIGFALRGAFLLVKTEPSIKIQLFIAILVTIAGVYFGISRVEWMVQILAIGFVMGIEGINTAIEKICDYQQPNFDEKIGFIKDISAGAVMLVSIAAVIVGLIIYLPKIF
jgi:diacylglycerol kinase (ATP)